MSRPRTFVVLTTARSGSSWLVDLLDSHPGIAAYAELFLVGTRDPAIYGSRDVPRFEATLELGRRSTSSSLVLRRNAHLARLAVAHRGLQAVGFKLLYSQADVHPGLYPWLALRRARFVHLVRRNVLDGVVSWEAATALGRYLFKDGEAIPRVRLRIEPNDLLERLMEREQAVERWRRRLARLRLRVVEVVYEDLLDRRDEELARILRFLGVERGSASFTTSLVRSTPVRTADAIENYEEVRAALVGTRFEWMLRDSKT